MKNLKYLNKYFLKYKWHLGLGIIFVTLNNYFKSLIPQEIREALDYVLNQVQIIKDQGETSANLNAEILKFAGIVIGLALVMGVFMFLMRQTIIVMSRLIEYDIRKEIFAHYEKMDIAFFKRNRTGDLMSRISEDVGKVRMYLGPALLYGINLTTLFVLVIYSMIKVNPTLTLWTLLPLPFLSISIYFVSSLINKRSEYIQIQLAKLNSIAQEVYSGIKVVKSYSKEDQFRGYFSKESEEFKEKSLSLARVNALFFPLMILLISISTLITVFIGALQVKKGLATPGNIAEFVIYVNYLTWPFTVIGWIASIIQQAEASQKRINEFLEEEPAIVNPPNGETELTGDIVFKNVSFTYPDTGVKALSNVSFTITKGQKMAIVGKTASGKSTIADLLLRMYDIDTGEIQIGGHNIQHIDLNSLRSGIGYVPQDVFLFSDTIANNIKFGKRDASSEEIKEFADYASVHEDILKLPESYTTKIGERGVTLSGGQKQRVSIARALIKNPEIVVLDDALSAVDTTTEQQINNYLNSALANRTCINITHRIHNLMDYDLIIVLDKGEIIESGTHSDLIGLNGQYAEMYHQQVQLDS